MKNDLIVVIYEDEPEMEVLVNEARNIVIERNFNNSIRVANFDPIVVKTQGEFDKWLGSEAANSTHVALVDLQIDEDDWEGVRAVSAIRKDFERVNFPIVVFSKTASKTARKKAYDAGATSYVRKPANRDKLVESLADILGYWVERHEKRVA